MSVLDQDSQDLQVPRVKLARLASISLEVIKVIPVSQDLKAYQEDLVQLVKQVFQVEKERRESRIPLVLLGQMEKKGTRDSLGGLGIRVYLDFQDCQVAKAIQGFQGIRISSLVKWETVESKAHQAL